MIMEIKFKEGDSVNIPENCVAKIVDNVVVFEPKKVEFKKGDFVGTTLNKKCFFVYRDEDCGFFGIDYNGELKIGDYSHGSHNLRHLTDSEKQTLLDELHKFGKDWDVEKCEIVDWTWKPEIGQCIFGLSCVGVNANTWRNFSYQKDAFANKMIFRTRELAETAFELIKNAKHF